MARVTYSGEPGETFTNETGKVLYQFFCNWSNTCGQCSQYDSLVGPSWPIPMHRGCRCVQRAIWPGKTSAPFTDFRAKIDALAPDQQAKVVGVANLKLIESGVVKWEDVVTGQRVRDLREVVATKKLSVATMTKAGVSEGIAQRAYATVNTPAHVLADQQRQELLAKVLAKGVTKAQLKQALGERLAARVGITGPGGAAAMPVTPTPAGPAPKAKAKAKPKPAAKVEPVPLPVEAVVDYLVKAKVKPEVAKAVAEAEAAGLTAAAKKAATEQARLEAAAKVAAEVAAKKVAAEVAARVKAEAEAARKAAEAAAKKKAAEEAYAAELAALKAARLKAEAEAVARAAAAKPAWTPKPQSTFREFTDSGSETEKWGKAAYKDWADTLPLAEKQALKVYAADNFKWMNALLRGDPLTGDAALPYGMSEASARDYIARARAPLARATVPEDIVVFRGVKDSAPMGWTDQSTLKPGQELTIESFGSASLKKTRAADFATDLIAGPISPNAVLLQLNTPKGSSGAYINAAEISQYDDERELLMPPDARFKYVGPGKPQRVAGIELPVAIFERIP